jgi:hypothetical protein
MMCLMNNLNMRSDNMACETGSSATTRRIKDELPILGSSSSRSFQSATV